MFKSKMRDVIIPQSEHARLSGYMAQAWGNDDIAPPPVDRQSFTTGVTYHDRGYGHLDNMPIGEVDERIWLATQKRGIVRSLADPVADAVALLHIRRLLDYGDIDGADPIRSLADERIEQAIAATDYTRQTFDRVDTITHLCDSLSFAFCFEEPTHFEQPVYSHGERVPIQVHIMEAGRVELHPYPLAVPALHGFILGYAASGYPDHLEPVMVDFVITSADESATS